MYEGQNTYFRLDKFPEMINLPNGKIIKKGEILTKGPGKFFYIDELYTTNYFGQKNDEIERHLFGKIDTDGAAAISAMSSPDWMRLIHPHILKYFEYMDAQRLRTPKGLNWLIKVTKPKSYNDLLMKMQDLRTMHITMWAEASMEIVGANNSGTKFIVSDSPVTFYNSVFYPKNAKCLFPNDPEIYLKGTRTIFPLDMNHCAILTNLEYARSPGKLKAPKSRTNPRYFGNTINKYDDIIREREFKEEQVLSINYILKKRATKYIAAANEDWLYPEKYLKKTNWGALDSVFISKSTKLFGINRETFIGGKGGKLIATQDEFGRKPKSEKEWLEKEKQANAMREHVMKLLAKKRSKK